MPPRLAIPPRSIRPHLHCIPRARAFHCGAHLSAAADSTASKNHYERLNIRHDASLGEIKKSFYSLSKTHHPDVNPSDPRAAQTFSLLSESYTVLSNPSTRAKYDRDVLRLQQQQDHHQHRASYHSSHPAGGRTPSGLSRRRGSFRGPPPSFYRNGAWGAQTERRRRAEAEAAAATGAGAHNGGSSSSSSSSSSRARGPHRGRHPGAQHDAWDGADASARPYTRAQYGGMGPGSDPFSFGGGGGGADSVPPHFDREGHTRTHRREDARREDRSRRKRALGDDDVEFEPQMSLAGHFMIVAGILGATFLAPLVYVRVRGLGRQERK
ncbi:hypothetical protein E4U55_001407 [Claviceps digitariae]|nr:hypothetical protein E4U55_001407 [Claviceps digitariae]